MSMIDQLDDAITLDVPEVKFDLPKVNITSPDSKKLIRLTPTVKTADPLKADIDRYEALTTAVNKAKNAIDKLKLAEEDLKGQDKIKNLEEQIQKNKELAKSYNDVKWEQEQERKRITWEDGR